MILGTTLAGAGFGSLISALVAGDIPNHELEAFRTKINHGYILLMLDVSTRRVEEMTEMIKNTHPEAEIGIVKPS